MFAGKTNGTTKRTVAHY